MQRFTKIGTDGRDRSEDSMDFVAVRDNTVRVISGEPRMLIWHAVGSRKRSYFGTAHEEAARTDLCGWTDWRVPTLEELASIVDRTRCDPAIDGEFFPMCKSDAYWTATATAAAPAVSGWLIVFDNGGVYNFNHSVKGFVRVVRSIALPRPTESVA